MAKDDLYQPVRGVFESWEKYTAQYWDQVLRSPLLLEMLGQNLELALGLQSSAAEALERFWQAWGLPSRSAQELALHRLNQLQAQVQRLSRRIDHLLAESNGRRAGRRAHRTV